MSTSDVKHNCYKCGNPIDSYQSLTWWHGSRYHTDCVNGIPISEHPIFAVLAVSGSIGPTITLSNEDVWILPKKDKRDSWDVYFIKQADFVSTRATCDRKHCGAVITKNNKVISTGYNGSGSKEPHCDDAGHFLVNGHCVRTIHAEINAIQDAKERLSSLEGCKIYINTYPCWSCFGRIAKEGIKEVFYKDEYRNDEMIEKTAALFDIKITKVTV